MTKLKLAFSTCPNDTFIFDAWVNGHLPNALATSPFLGDIDHLNAMAKNDETDIIKISYHAFIHLAEKYIMLDAGSALGFGVGPLLIAKNEISLNDIHQLRIAIPGELTTAAMLLKYAFPEAVNTTVMLFSEIEEAILSGTVDAGVIIHENRFTYQQKGLIKLLDLGSYWEEKTTLPIPLGGIAVRRSFNKDQLLEINVMMQKSVEFAFANPKTSMPYVKRYAANMDTEVMQQHINLYVNNETLKIDEQGKKAVRTLAKLIRPDLPDSLPLFTSDIL